MLRRVVAGQYLDVIPDGEYSGYALDSTAVGRTPDRAEGEGRHQLSKPENAGEGLSQGEVTRDGMAVSSSGSTDHSLVIDEPIILERTVQRKRNGIVISYSIRSEETAPLAVRIRDPLPHQLAGEDRGFHSDYRPDDWVWDDDALLLEDAVTNEEDGLVKFGVLAGEGSTLDPDLPDPVIETIRPVDSSDGMVFPRDNGTGRPGAAADATDESHPAEQAEDDGDASILPSGPADGIDGRAGGGGAGLSGSDESGGRPGDDPAKPSGGPPSEDDPRSEARGAGTAVDAPESKAVIDAEPLLEDESPTPDDGHAVGSDSPIPEADSAPAPADATGGDGPADESGATHEGSILRGLLDELAATELTEEERGILRDRLGLEPRKSIDVRLGHLESRIERFSALADEMEGFIDEHSDGSDFVTRLDEAMADLDDEITRLGRENEDAREGRVELREELRGMRSRTDELESQAEKRVSAAEEALSDRIEEEVARVETELLTHFESEIGDVRSHVSEEVDGIERRLRAQEASLDGMEERIDGTESSLESATEDLTAEIEEQERRFDDAIDDVEASLSKLRAELDETYGAVDEEIRDIEERLVQLDGDIETLRLAKSEEIEDLADRLADVERMRSVFVDAFEEFTRDDEP